MVVDNIGIHYVSFLHTMRYSLFESILSLLLIAVILCATTAGLCHEAHAAEEVLCKQCPAVDKTSRISMLDGQSRSCPDAGHTDHEHGGSACYCPCHLPVSSTKIQLLYSPDITSHLTQITVLPPQDIFLSLFVPPDSSA